MTVGKILKMIIYTRTTSGVRRIKELNMPLMLCGGNRKLSVGLNCEEVNKYLQSINEQADCYEEITYYISDDDETVTLCPKKLVEGKNEV